ncbi:hypothetical protein Tco_0995495 [Tanacetum coccineum]
MWTSYLTNVALFSSCGIMHAKGDDPECWTACCLNHGKGERLPGVGSYWERKGVNGNVRESMGLGGVTDFSLHCPKIVRTSYHVMSIVNGNRVGCSYKEFLACNPKEYDGKGGAVVFTRWIEKMDTVQDMSGCNPHNAKPRSLLFSMSWNDLKSRKIERYVYGLAPQIRGMVAATEPKTMQKAV